MKANFCDIVKKRIQNSHFHKFDRIAPEGFILIPIETLERLRNFDNWKEWKSNPNILQIWGIEDTKKI